MFINQIIALEALLNNILLDYFLKDANSVRRAAYRQLILEGRFFTIYDKRKVFCELMKSCLVFEIAVSEEDGRNLRKELQEIIEHRNHLAHVEISVELSELYGIIEYKKGSKTIKEKLDTKKKRQYMEKVTRVHEQLFDIYEKIKQNKTSR